MSRVSDSYTDQEFEDLLDVADDQASGRKEQDFVSDMRDKFVEWGVEMFLSEAQQEWLERIANR